MIVRTCSGTIYCRRNVCLSATKIALSLPEITSCCSKEVARRFIALSALFRGDGARYWANWSASSRKSGCFYVKLIVCFDQSLIGFDLNKRAISWNQISFWSKQIATSCFIISKVALMKTVATFADSAQLFWWKLCLFSAQTTLSSVSTGLVCLKTSLLFHLIKY